MSLYVDVKIPSSKNKNKESMKWKISKKQIVVGNQGTHILTFSTDKME